MPADLSFGNKSRILERLAMSGFRIPPFFTLHARAVFSEGDLLRRISRELPNARFFAVRSSAANEDAADKSFAGHYHSALGVTGRNLLHEIGRVRESLGDSDGGIIIQDFIPSDKAGVLFTDAGNGSAVINATFGLCENVVRGFSCDEYIIDSGGRSASDRIPRKNVLVFEGGGFVHRHSDERVLDALEIASIMAIGKRIESALSAPQDIEWCMLKGEFFVLQSRPITKAIFRKPVRHFDSANIAESYSGIVLPLTFSFASRIYGSVYRRLLMASGVSPRMIGRHPSVFGNMIRSFYGRMYYDMNSWHAMMRFLPGYGRNRKNLELMITGNIRQDTAVDDGIRPSLRLRAIYPFLVALKLFRFERTIGRFKLTVSAALLESRALDFSTLTLSECVESFISLETRLLGNWHVTVENDFLVMTAFGILERHVDDAVLRSVLAFSNIGADQIPRFHEISRMIESVPSLREYILQKDAKGFYGYLDGHPEAGEPIAAYFLKYGGRFANELKLESRDLEDDFSRFSDLVRLYSRSRPSSRPRPIGEIPALHGIFLNFILRKFRKYAAQREELRLLRSNAFSLVRKIFNRIGELLAENGRIGESGDIFYMGIEEVLSGNIPDASQLAHRKKEYGSFEGVDPPAYFSLSEGEELHVIKRDVPQSDLIRGRACSSGTVIGRVRIFKEFSVPKSIDFEILVARFTDPGWAVLIGKARGLIIENGGILSHAAIIARELGIPTVIGAVGATDILQDGQYVELDGSTGLVTIVSHP